METKSLTPDFLTSAIRENKWQYGLYVVPLGGDKIVYGFSERISMEEASAEIESKGFYGQTIFFNYVDPKDNSSTLLMRQQLNATRRRK